MNQINFLPESFNRTRRRQQRRPIEFAIIGGTALVLIAMWLYMAGPDSSLAQQAEVIDQQIQRIEQQQTEEDRLKQERSRLTRRLLIARETYQPIQTTQILSRLSELTPEPVRLIHFELVAARPAPESAPNTDVRNSRVVRSQNETTRTKPRDPNVMKLSLTGLAPTDDEIVALIRQLERDPVFSSVTLRNSTMSKTKTHFAREFKLDIEIDLDRRFVPISGQGGDNDAD